MLDWETAVFIAAVCLAVGQTVLVATRKLAPPYRVAAPSAKDVAPATGNTGRAREKNARWRTIGAFVREAGLILALYGLWQLVGSLSFTHGDDAVSRGEWIWRTERRLGLPNEADLQHLVIGHPWLVHVCDVYYATMHFSALIAMLVWVFLRHREAYPRVRFLVAATTAACLAVGFVPVAPPRLIPVGMVDTARMYGESVYTSTLTVDQYGAMPSVHVAWAALVPLVVIMVGNSGWRWLALLHFVITVFVVVATANHYWADGIVALGLLGAVFAVQYASLHVLRYRTVPAQPPVAEKC